MDSGEYVLFCGVLRFWYALFTFSFPSCFLVPSLSFPLPKSTALLTLLQGGFFFTLGATLTPAFNAYGAYTSTATTVGAGSWDGITSTGFHASYAFFLLFMGLMCLVFVICALRTNVALVTVHFGLMMTFLLLAGSYWETAQEAKNLAYALQQVRLRFPRAPCISFFASKLCGTLLTKRESYRHPVHLAS